jgi:Nucleotidyl transferase AbiEii toxin, Type IV TA system
MIPQRNLSLLANRLYKEHGGRRIPEAVLERDYCLAWFLVGLGQSRLHDLLIFKGGTALKRCHFVDYRFSEDLDFTLSNKVGFAEIRAGMEEIYERQCTGGADSVEAAILTDRATNVAVSAFLQRRRVDQLLIFLPRGASMSNDSDYGQPKQSVVPQVL